MGHNNSQTKDGLPPEINGNGSNSAAVGNNQDGNETNEIGSTDSTRGNKGRIGATITSRIKTVADSKNDNPHGVDATTRSKREADETKEGEGKENSNTPRHQKSLHNEQREQGIIGTLDNLETCGDTMQPRREDDGLVRFGFQNIHTLKKLSSENISEELLVVQQLGINVCGFVEINKPWTAENKHIFKLNMDCLFEDQNITAFASMPTSHDTTYLPGGVMQTVVGPTAGRKVEQGTDKYGRFAWHTLRGGRDEGILVITCYRVAQESIGGLGPKTAYMQQFTAMVKDGMQKPQPRSQIFTDLIKLIREKRELGFRPIVMMDANGTPFTDTKFRDFLAEACLVDPYYDRFLEMPRTYIRGNKRLDYIVMDEGLTHAIERIGYLGSHEAVHSDHSMAWVDFREKDLFRGIINRPVPYPCRQFTLHQSDKCELFINELRSQIELHRIPSKVAALLQKFISDGATPALIKQFNALDTEYTQLILCALKKTGRKKYGYFRSPELTQAGQLLNLHKAILDCTLRKAPPSSGLLKLAELLGYDLSSFEETNATKQRKRVREARQELREVQKQCIEKRVDWLEQLAQRRSSIEGKDWEAVKREMIRTAQESSTNRKLTAITKGSQARLDRIEMPVYEWTYSPTTQDLYHFKNNVFETHAKIRAQNSDDNAQLFYKHHTLKVPANDAVPVAVEPTAEGNFQIKEVFPKPASMYKSVTSQKEIEKELLWRNKRHLQQVAYEEGPTTRDPISALLREGGMSAEADALLRGEYEPRDSLTQEPIEVDSTMAEWLKQLQQTDKERELAPTVGVIKPEDFQEAFKKAREKTSSNGELHYTVWKCMAREDDFAEWLSIMMSIPFIYGFAPTRWQRMIDVMLEKKKGIRQIHQLRIIGLLEADLNTALKYFARELSQKMEESGELSNEQWGSRKNRTSIDAALLKLLTFETARNKKATVGSVYYDCAACFDRMDPSMSNYEARRRNVDQNILDARSQVIKGMKRRVRTGLGVSDDYYSEEPGDKTVGGEVQGKADVPTLWTATSSTMLKTHAALAPGLQLNSCTKQRSMKRHNICYVDDNDGQTSAQPESEDPMAEVLSHLDQSTQLWSDITNFTGQTLAFHKTKWQLLAWEVIKHQKQIIMSTNHTLMITDHKGAASIITFLPPDQPNEGLGFNICPDGNQQHEFNSVMKKLREISAASSSAFLTVREARQMLYQRLIPKISYPLHLTSFNREQCSAMNTVVRNHFFPMLRFNRKSSGDVMYGPMEQGGMELPEWYSRQTELQVPYLIKQLRMNGTVANDLLTTLDTLQLVSGLTTPVFEYKKPLRYLDRGFLTCLHDRMQEIDATVWIEEAWTPKLQREHDESIMEAFMERPRMSKDLLHKLNSVRLYLRVITIADLVSPDGTFIGNLALRGEWRADSELEWPDQPKPPKKWFDLFRRHIRQTFCTRLDNRHPAGDSMDLDVPLGKWYPVPRNTWYDVYLSPGALYKRTRRNDGTSLIQKFEEKHRLSGYWKYVSDVQELPLGSFPIDTYETISEYLWTHRKWAPNVDISTPKPKPPGYISIDTHATTTTPQPKEICSDGSAHPYEEIAAAAWVIATSQDEYIKACFLMTDISSVNAYRSELEGIFRSLFHMEQTGMIPAEEVIQWCDNLSGIEKCRNRPMTGKDVMAAEGDIILAIHHLKERLTCKVTHKHVHGHQDTKRRKKNIEADSDSESDDDSLETTESTKITTDNTLSNEAKMNVACDELAGDATNAALNNPENLPEADELLRMPYAGSKAVLRIGNKWITSKEKIHLMRASRGPSLKDHIKRRRNWTDAQYDSVFWTKIGEVRRRLGIDQQRFTTKVMHDLLAVGHVRRHVTKVSQCPGCSWTDETFAHLLKCPNRDMQSKRDEIIAALRKKGLRKLPRQVLATIADIVHQYSIGDEVWPRITHPALSYAVGAQAKLGWENFFRGYLVKAWVVALRETSRAPDVNPYQQFDQLQQLVWFDIVQPQWYARNSVAHGPTSNLTLASSSRLSTLLTWYNAHREEILPAYLQPLAERNIDDIRRMSNKTKKEWIYHLETASAAWKKTKQYHEGHHQRTMIEYLTLPIQVKKPPARNAVREARDYAERMQLNVEINQPKIDEIFAPRK